MVEATGTMPKPATTPSPNVAGQAQNPAANADPSKSTNHRTVNAPFQMQNLGTANRWLKILFYGRHGAGKTELAATAVDCPQMNDVLFISAESGLMTVVDSPRVKNFDRVYDIPVTSFKQVAQVHDFLRAYCAARDANDINKMRNLFCQVTGMKPDDVPEPPKFRTVVIDSLTEVETYCTYGILGIDSTKITDDIDTAGWPEFRKNNEMVKLLARAFRDLPMHVIFTCAEQWTQDEQKRHHYTPALTGKLSAQVQGFVDIVGYIVVGQIQEGQEEAPRRVFIQPIAGGIKFDAKNRRPVYKKPFFDNPSMSSIMKDIGMLK